MAPEAVVRRRVWVGEEGEGGRRVREVGKWPVWKVEMGRRCWPERDLGSMWGVSGDLLGRKRVKGEAGWILRTLRIELQNVDITIRVCRYDVQLLSVWKKVRG